MKCFLPPLLIVTFAAAAHGQGDSVDAYVRGFIAQRKIPAAAISVVRKGQVVKAAGYGMANLELNVPATEHSVFEIGSISKQFSSEAVMMLVAEGRIGVDDLLTKYLPEVPAAWGGITIRHLLTHTSGLHDWEGDSAFSYRREYTTSEFIAFVARHPLDFAPGSRWAYTNSAFPLLGKVIEKVSGMPYERFVTERIFKPAGMVETRFKHHAEIVPNHAGGYMDEAGTLKNGEPLRPTILAPNGGILSTAADMARWHIALSKGTLLSPATMAQMLTPVRLNDGSKFSGGMAWFLDEFRGHHFILHNGSTVAGFSAVVYRYLDDDVSVTVLLNIDRWNAVNVLAINVASFFAPGVAMRSLAERPDPDPALSQRLLTLLGDVADGRDSEMLAANLRNPGGPVRTNATLGFKAPSAQISLLEVEDHGSAGIEHFGAHVRWVYRYRITGGGRTVYYTIELTPEGKVTRFVPEEG